MARACLPSTALGSVVLCVVLAGLSACASSPSPASVPVAPVVEPPSLDTKVAWILRLEQQRVLRDDRDATDVTDAAAPAAAPAPGFLPALEPDLSLLLRDPDPVIRARAALAVGRVAGDEAGDLLESALADPADTVRRSAAFALGLLGRPAAVPALQTLLADVSVEVRGRAVEALGLIGDGTAAPAVLEAAAGCDSLLAPILPDDEEWPKTPDIELCRLALYAFVRLQAWDALAQVALYPDGRPISRWWPVAYALQRIGDRRAIPALRELALASGTYSAGFALKGLAAFEDSASLPAARLLLTDGNADVKLRVAAIRLIARVGETADVTTLVRLLGQEPSSSPLVVEIIAALGELRAAEAFDVLVDGVSDPAPAVRAASLAAAARVNPDGFQLVLSGLGRDPDWTVRAALATVLGTLPADRVVPALVDLSADEDARVHAVALRALAALKVADLGERLRVGLAAEDFSERAAAADLMAELRPPGGAPLLAEAYLRGESDSAYAARFAAVEAIAVYGAAEAAETLQRALLDREWPVRLRAAALLEELGVPDAEPSRPALLRRPASFFESDALLHPAFSPRAFIETRRGVIEVQLEVVDAPLTVATFIEQVRSGLFNGLRVHRLIPAFVIQTGDPRGDGTGGPGYTQRDEFNSTPYLRGTLGMALAGPETGGSQWFITTSPQPHLDARYTAFGRVVGGWDVLDRIVADDVIERVRIWDGIELR